MNLQIITYNFCTGKKDGTAFLDEIYEYLSIKNIDPVVVDALQRIVMLEEYDSESIADDVIDINDVLNECNVSLMLKNKECFEWIEKFVKYANGMFLYCHFIQIQII